MPPLFIEEKMEDKHIFKPWDLPVLILTIIAILLAGAIFYVAN